MGFTEDDTELSWAELDDYVQDFCRQHVRKYGEILANAYRMSPGEMGRWDAERQADEESEEIILPLTPTLLHELDE